MRFGSPIRAALPALLALPLALAGCGERSPTSTVPKPDQPRGPDRVTTLEKVGSYRIMGDTLSMTLDAWTRAWCETGKAKTQAYPAETSSSRISFRGDTLVQVNLPVVPPESGAGGGNGYVLRLEFLSVRQSEGTGAEGRWRYLGARKTLVSGTAPDSMKARWVREAASDFANAALSVSEMELSGGVYRSGSRTFWAPWQLAYWSGAIYPNNPKESDAYAIEARALDSLRLEYKGLKTKETVIKTIRGLDWEEFSSDNPAHPPYAQGGDGKTCHPDPISPWFSEFMEANRKVEWPPDHPEP